MRTETDGTLVEVLRGGRSLALYTYAPDGRVSSIDYGEGRRGTFEYDGRGFRTTADYVYGSEHLVSATMAYDAAGNLIRLERGEEGDGTTEESYEIGDYNELQWVRNGDGVDGNRPQMTFGYDAAGRVVRAGVGRRNMTVEYDALDRATRLAVDGEVLLEKDYGPDDMDVAESGDERTAEVRVAS